MQDMRDGLPAMEFRRWSSGLRLVLVQDRGEGVDLVAVEQDVDLDEIGGLLTGRLVVERGVAAGLGLQLVEEVEDDLGEREGVAQLDAVLGEVVHAEQCTAAAL